MILRQILTAFAILAFGFLLGFASADEDYYSPENIRKFADYLYQEKDYLRAAGEYEKCLSSYPKEADEVLYRLGLCYRMADNTGKAVESFDKLLREYPDSPLRFRAEYQIAYSHFLSGRYADSVLHLNKIETSDSDNRGMIKILKASNYLHQRQWLKAEDELGLIPENRELKTISLALRTTAQKGVILPRKKPLLAGIFSTMLPGSGRIYCGQYGDGVYSFILTVGSGLLAWDGFNDGGAGSVKGWIFGIMSVVFYAGNIYGSRISAMFYNRQLEDDLLRDLPKIPDEW